MIVKWLLSISVVLFSSLFMKSKAIPDLSYFELYNLAFQKIEAGNDRKIWFYETIAGQFGYAIGTLIAAFTILFLIFSLFLNKNKGSISLIISTILTSAKLYIFN